jgi:hypothetical protein
MGFGCEFVLGHMAFNLEESVPDSREKEHVACPYRFNREDWQRGCWGLFASGPTEPYEKEVTLRKRKLLCTSLTSLSQVGKGSSLKCVHKFLGTPPFKW